MEGSHSAYYTFEETMEVLGIDKGRLKRLVSEAELTPIREGGSFRFRKRDVDALKPKGAAPKKHPDYYSFEETMAKLGIDQNRLLRLVTEGEIRASRDGGKMIFKKTEIDKLKARTDPKWVCPTCGGSEIDHFGYMCGLPPTP